MSLKTLPRHRFARTSAEGGGGGAPAGDGTGTPPAGSGTPPEGTPPAGTGSTEPVEARDEHGAGLGFPKDTPVEQMNADQKANYWRNQTKIANKRVPSNLTQLQQDAAAWAEYQRTQKPPEQQAIETARQEAAAAARKEVAEDAALSLLRVTLTQRGKEVAEIDEIVDRLNPAKFLTTDGKMDTVAVTAFADKLVPSQSGGGGNGYGQGRFDRTQTSRAAAGKAESERRGFTKASGTSSLLPQNR